MCGEGHVRSDEPLEQGRMLLAVHVFGATRRN